MVRPRGEPRTVNWCWGLNGCRARPTFLFVSSSRNEPTETDLARAWQVPLRKRKRPLPNPPSTTVSSLRSNRLSPHCDRIVMGGPWANTLPSLLFTSRRDCAESGRRGQDFHRVLCPKGCGGAVPPPAHDFCPRLEFAPERRDPFRARRWVPQAPSGSLVPGNAGRRHAAPVGDFSSRGCSYCGRDVYLNRRQIAASPLFAEFTPRSRRRDLVLSVTSHPI